MTLPLLMGLRSILPEWSACPFASWDPLGGPYLSPKRAFSWNKADCWNHMAFGPWATIAHLQVLLESPGWA